MKTIIFKIATALRQSTWFKKYSMGIGAFLLGMLFQESFWREIRQTLDVWGISRSEWHAVLLAIIGFTGVTTSVYLSARMTSLDKIEVADKALDKEKKKMSNKTQ